MTLDGTVLGLPAGVRLDLGATAKGLGSDRAAAAAYRASGRGGMLVSLGGDIAVAGQPPVGGWPVAVADSSDGRGAPGQVVRLTTGALATSSVTGRRWQRDGRPVHHIVDPRTGWPAAGPWRTVSVAASSCAEANAASTAAIVAGPDAEAWLAGTGLPSRLVAHDGAVRLLGGWPDTDGGRASRPGAGCPPGGPGSPAMSGTGSQGLWFVSRGSGLVLLVLLTVVMVLGIATRAGWAPRTGPASSRPNCTGRCPCSRWRSSACTSSRPSSTRT